MEKKRDYYIEREHAKEINVKDFFDIIKNGIWLILVMTILSTSVGYAMSDNHTLLYQTETRIIIGSDSEYMKTLMVMIKDPLVMEEVQGNLHLSRSTDSIAGQVDVMRIDDSQVIKIAVTDKDPKMAVAIADATAIAFKAQVVDLLEFEDVQLLSSAKESSFPINGGGQHRIIMIACVFGLIAGIVLVFILNSLDETIKKEREAEAILGVPMLGMVSKIKVKSKRQRKKTERYRKVELGSDIGDLK